MRPTTVMLGVLGAVALAGGLITAFATGQFAVAGWLLVGPGPFYAVGLALAVRRPDRSAGLWCLAAGTMFMVSVVLGDVILPVIAGRPGAWMVALVRQWAEGLSCVAGVALFGWYPGGRPQRAYERWVVYTAAALATALPLLYSLSHPLMAPGVYPNPEAVRVASPLFRPEFAVAGPVVGVLAASTIGWTLVGFGMLATRYRHVSVADKRRIRLLLLGMSVAIVLFTTLLVAGSVLDSATERLVAVILWPLIQLTTLGSIVLGVLYDGTFAIDAPLRRSMLYRVLWTLIAAAYVSAAAALGVLAASFLSAGAAILLAAGAALLFQPVQRRLEGVADRWVFGARLDGYRVLARFGRALEAAPRSADLLSEMAEAVRDGLGLTWVRVHLEPGPTGVAGSVVGEPALVVALVEAGAHLGRIECGPRTDGPLLDEDRRLLQHLAGQAATAVRNLHLTAELTARLRVIRRQADDLAASRARIVTAQDAERRRIQRDLHDGVQQEIVVLATTLAMARRRLGRGGPGADELLAEAQRDLTTLLHHVREFAHAIHPPVLADQGLLEAIEAQAARLPLGVVIEADAALRGVHYPQHVEATAWYVLSEALTNVVKHAGARQVRVRLGRPDGRLTLEVRDDGAGFDTGTTGGHGLAGLADRVATVDGTLKVESRPGHGTTLRAEIPLPEPADA